MNRWVLKKRWYSHKQWVMRRVISALLVMIMTFGPGFPFGALIEKGDLSLVVGRNDRNLKG